MRLLRDINRRWRRLGALAPAERTPREHAAVRAQRRAAKRAAARRTAVVRLAFFAMLVAATATVLARHPRAASRSDAIKGRAMAPANALLEALAAAAVNVSTGVALLPARAPPPRTATQPPAPQRMFSRRCFRSRRVQAALCVHRPLCATSAGPVAVGGARACVAGVTSDQCAAEERLAEEGAAVSPVSTEHDWLADAESAGRVHWWAGSTVIVRAGARAASPVQFARRVLAAHHVRAHAARYGLPNAASVVLVADRAVARRMRFRRSWHHALLAALAHPRAPVFDRNVALAAAQNDASEPAVAVLVGWRALAPDAAPRTPARKRPLACFRHAAFAAPGSRFLLERAAFPKADPDAVADDDWRNARSDPTQVDADARAFRSAMFGAVVGRAAPPARRRVVYLHRTRVRAIEAPDGLGRLEHALSFAAIRQGFEYTRVDMDGLPVAAVLAAVGDAGVIVGVHGTTLLSTLFLASGSAIVEIMPYRFSHTLYARAPGAPVMYSSHSLLKGDEYAALLHFTSPAECLAVSRRCRAWYRSDSRPLLFGERDARRVATLVQRGMEHVTEHIVSQGGAVR